MNPSTIAAVGSALIHFLWEGAALTLLLYVALSFARDVRLRYALAVCALMLMALCPVVTIFILEKPAAVAAVFEESPASVMFSTVTVAWNNQHPVKTLDALSCLVWFWSAGVFIFAMRAFGGWLVLQKFRRTAHQAICPALLECCRRLQQRIGITAAVRYAHSGIVDAPAVLGWVRPVVLIPVSVLSGLSQAQIEAIIAHELAHIKRYDGLVNLFQIAVETVLFYHPGIWWVNRIIRTERENCCDDIAVAVCGNPSEYARALAMLSTSSARPVWAMAANGGTLKARVARLLGLEKIAHGLPRTGLAIFAILCTSCVLIAAGTFRQDVPAPPPPPSAAPAPPTVPVDLVPSPTPDPPRLPSRAEALMPRSADTAPPLAPATEEHAGGSFIDSLAAVGLTKLTVDELISLKIQGVTAAYVGQIKAAGLESSIHDLIALKIQGVTPEYVRDIRATGLKPSLHDLLAMKIQGVTPEFVRGLQAEGLGDLQPHHFLEAKIQGVSPEFVRNVRSHGFKDLTFRQCIQLKMAGVL